MMPKPYMTRPIRTVEDARSFITDLHFDGKLYHFDDPPEDVVESPSGARTFTDAEADYVALRVAEMFMLDGFDPFEFALDLPGVC